MKPNNLIKKARAKFEMIRLSKGRGTQTIEVPEIPIEREFFLNTTDEWQKIHLPEIMGSASCMYYAKKGNYFPPHKHLHSTEQILILNPTGKVRVITSNEIKDYVYPQSIFFDKNKPHAVLWLEDTDALCIWHPEFKKGWEANI